MASDCTRKALDWILRAGASSGSGLASFPVRAFFFFLPFPSVINHHFSPFPPWPLPAALLRLPLACPWSALHSQLAPQSPTALENQSIYTRASPPTCLVGTLAKFPRSPPYTSLHKSPSGGEHLCCPLCATQATTHYLASSIAGNPWPRPAHSPTGPLNPGLVCTGGSREPRRSFEKRPDHGQSP